MRYCGIFAPNLQKLNHGLIFIDQGRVGHFARRLEADLQDAGLQAWIDRSQIRVGEEWRQSLQRGIQWADFSVFCLSADSVVSEVCHWELNFLSPYQALHCLSYPLLM